MVSMPKETTKSKMQLRYRKKERTKEEIIAVAERFYSERPISEVLLEDIAEAAFISRTTIYNYFRDKNEVLFAVGNKVFRELNETLAATVPQGASGKEQVLFLCTKTFKDGRDDPIILTILNDTFHHIKDIGSTPESITEDIVKRIGRSTLNDLIQDPSPSKDFDFADNFDEPNFVEFFIQLLRYGDFWARAIKKGKDDRTIKNGLDNKAIVLYVTMLINGMLSEMELRRISSKVVGIEEGIIIDSTLDLISHFLERNVPSSKRTHHGSDDDR